MKKLVTFVACFLLLFTSLAPVMSTSEIDDMLFVDYSNLEHGTIKVSVVDPNKPLNYKLRVTWEEEVPEGSDKTTVYFYNIPTGIEMTTIPLQMGNGTYLIELFEQIVDEYYQADPVGSIELELESNNKDVWLEPNVKVNFSSPERLLEVLDEIVSPSDTELDKYNKIAMYMLHHYCYDWMAVYTDTVPENADLNRVIERGLGTCEEQSALMVALLRLSGIQSRLVIGRLGGKAHAWVEAIVNNRILSIDPSYYYYEVKQPARYVPERYY